MRSASSPHDVARVQDATSLAELVGEHTWLRQIGRYYVGRCPIEAEDTLSSTVNFPTPAHLCSGAALTPKHRESDIKTRRGKISKQGSRLLRWVLIEGISCYRDGEVLERSYHQIATRRGVNKARVAVARKVLTLAYYGLRDGEIRCLAPTEAAA